MHASAPSVSIALAGSGGSVVMSACTMLLDAAARAGLYGLMVRTAAGAYTSVTTTDTSSY